MSSAFFNGVFLSSAAGFVDGGRRQWTFCDVGWLPPKASTPPLFGRRMSVSRLSGFALEVWGLCVCGFLCERGSMFDLIICIYNVVAVLKEKIE